MNETPNAAPAAMPRRRCGNCRWWLPDPANPNNIGKRTGTCHGSPPGPVVMITANAAGQPVQTLTSAWPPVGPDELPCSMHNFVPNPE